MRILRLPSLARTTVCLALSLFAVHARADEPAPARRELAAVHREMALLLQGKDPAPVEASPVLCHPGGTPSGAYAGDAEHWYFGKKGCRLEYPPRPNAIVTTVSEDGWKTLFFQRPGAPERLISLLQEMQGLAVAGKLTPHERLIVQSSAWEIAYGLQRFSKQDEELAPHIAPVLRETMRLIELTLLSKDEVKKFPSTLADLPATAGAPEIAPTVKRILAHDPGIVEVWSPTELHADLLFGRFASRLFLTADEDAERERLSAYLHDPKTPYDDLRSLPLHYAGVRAILVLYFNALTEDLTIVPTEEVAFWQEYTFTGKTSFDLSLDEMLKRIWFVTASCDYDLAEAKSGQTEKVDGLKCHKVDQNGMARRAFLDVKPVIMGDRVTSHRGHCLRCHRNQISTFDTHGRRRVEFLRPLERGGREMLTPFYIDHVENKLRQWAREPRPERAPEAG